jgi:hypothetical protein
VKHDKPLLAMLIGVIVVIPIEIMALMFKHFGWITITNGEACSMMFIPQGSWYLGLLALPSVGALAILMMYQFTRIIGIDYLIIKGMIIGMVAYAFVFCIFGVLGHNDRMIQSTLGNYLIAGLAGFGGGLAGFLMKKYLFADNQASQTNMVRKFTAVPTPAAINKERRRVRFIKPKKL